MKAEPFTTDIPLDNMNYRDFNPVVCGYSQCAPGQACLDFVRPYYLVHYVVSGKGIFKTSKKETYEVGPGDCFIMQPYKKYDYIADKNDPWYYIWVNFEGQTAQEFSNLLPVQKFNKVELFYNIKNSENIMSMRTEYVYAQLMLIYRELAPQKTFNHVAYAHKIKNEICSQYYKNIRVGDIAKACGIDRSYATQIFKKEFGITISEFITQYKMQRALEHLQSGHSVEETAAMTGFSDYTNFSRAFKRFYGTSPSKFKRIMFGNYEINFNFKDIPQISGGGKNYQFEKQRIYIEDTPPRLSPDDE